MIDHKYRSLSHAQGHVKDLAAGLDQSSGCREPRDRARSEDLVVMEGEADERHVGEPRVAAGGDDGDDDDNNSTDVAVAAGDGGFGINVMDLVVIVDGVLADLPEPARHHIFPELEENHGRARPAGTLLLLFRLGSGETNGELAS